MKLDKGIKDLVRQRARENLIDFAIATNPEYEPNWHLELIAQELEFVEKYGDRDFKILLIFMPPRHGKSELSSINFPAWYLGRNPENEIITASYSGELAQDFGAATRSLVDSPEYRMIFDLKLKEDERSKAKWKTQKGGSYTSVGVGGAITGRGANVFLIDDPLKNREEADSEVTRRSIWNWFTSTAFTRLEPNGVMVIILTRWHMDDLAGRILTHPTLSKRCKVVSFPAIAETDEAFRAKDEALWPLRYPLSALGEIKSTVGPYDWSALYQQQPILAENQEFKLAWVKTITQAEVDSMNTRKFLTIDTAMSKKQGADYTGFVDNRVNKENFWHIKGWHAKISPEELVDTIFSLHTKYHYEKIGIEKTAYSEGLKPYLDNEQRKRSLHLPIVELKHNQTNKEVRIRGLIPRYSAGSIKHILGECSALEEEMFTFPVGVHDDCLAEGTLILTDEGQIPIEQVKVGMAVMTRGGFQKVSKVWDKGVQPVITRYGLTATPDHKVITKEGDIHLQDVGLSSTLYIWNEKLSSIEERSTTEIQTLQDDSTGSITGDTMSGKSHQSLSTDRFGLITSARFLRNITSTTKIRILSIMHLITWNVFLPRTTLASMGEVWTENNTCLTSKIWDKNLRELGMVQKKDWNGTDNMLKIVSWVKKLLVNVWNVALNIRLGSKLQPNTAIKHVEQDGREGNLEGKTQTTTEKRVYDLMVENHHEFFANNILVHNCLDSLAYMLQIAEKAGSGETHVYKPKWLGFNRR